MYWEHCLKDCFQTPPGQVHSHWWGGVEKTPQTEAETSLEPDCLWLWGESSTARGVDKHYSHPGAGLFASHQKNCCSVECWVWAGTGTPEYGGVRPLGPRLERPPPTPLADTAAEKQDLAAPDMDKELSTPTNATPAIFTDTVAETPRQPLLLAWRATAVPTTPIPPLSVPGQNLGGGRERDNLQEEHLPCLPYRRSSAYRRRWTPSSHSSPSWGLSEASYGSWDILSSGGKVSLL